MNTKTNGTMHTPPRSADPGGQGPAQRPPPHPESPGQKHGHRKLFVTGALVVLAAAAVIVALVLLPRLREKKDVRDATEEMAVPTVAVTHPKPGEATVNATLPGNVQPLYDAPIYAQTNGYVKRWLVDIGTPVKAGQLLAEIDTPEVDQQLAQAVAARDQTQASLALSKTTSDRWQALLQGNAASKQETEEKQSDYTVQQANLAAAEANVKRLQAMQAFQKITAPFDGVITVRKIDVGALVTADNSSGQELFHIAQTGTLRIYVNVPEVFASLMKEGTPATVDLASAPGRAVQAKVVSTAGAIDPQSRTLLTQLQAANEDGTLLPGGYAQVHFQIALDKPPLIVPANTLLFRPTGPQIGVVGPDNVVKLHAVKIGRDFGTSVQILSGIDADDNVIVNPSDSLQEGAAVRVQQKPDAPKQ